MRFIDFKSSLVVFLIALPLCLGISLASGAPVLAGLIAGAVGGIIVGLTGGSEISVSGPAAGLTMVVLGAITELGSFDIFCIALIFAGVFQITIGFLKWGKIANFFPSSVIEGMLAAIGLILILKQLPHAVGYNSNFVGDEAFEQMDGQNTFSEILISMESFHVGASIIAILSILIILFWDKKLKQSFKWANYIPGALVAVLVSIGLNKLFSIAYPFLELTGHHLVFLPDINFHSYKFPLEDMNWNILLTSKFWKIVLVVVIVASIETLLSLDAADKLDTEKRISRKNRELKAQGLGNFISGLLGGLPLTAVIVRTSANVSAGAYSRYSAVLHGFWIIIATLFFTKFINLIPLSTLSGVLLVVGYKLINPNLMKKMWRKGLDQFLPFIGTITAILLTDLLVGIFIGMLIGIFFILKRSFHDSILLIHHEDGYLIRIYQNISFLNKAKLKELLMKIPGNSSVLIDGSRSVYIDEDIIDVIEDFMANAHSRGIKVSLEKSKLALSPFFREIANG